MRIPITDIKINSGRREAPADKIKELADSIAVVGLLNPITVNSDYTLIAGLHRLEAYKLLDMTEIECTVVELTTLEAELAEIDENLIRHDLGYLDESEQLSRRKEIYEALHPETRRGMRNGQTSKTETVSVLETKSFAQDTAEKLGVSPRTVEQKVQLAKKLTPKAKTIVQEGDVGYKNALKLSRLPPEQQEEAASLLVTGAIHSVDEYKREQEAVLQPPSEGPEPEAPLPEEPAPGPEPPAQEISPAVPDPPFKLPEKRYATFAEGVAALKDMDKDCTCTPDIFLAEFSEFAKRLLQEIEGYDIPYYAPAYPGLSRIQLDYLRQQIDAICSALDKYFKSVEVQTNDV